MVYTNRLRLWAGNPVGEVRSSHGGKLRIASKRVYLEWLRKKSDSTFKVSFYDYKPDGEQSAIEERTSGKALQPVKKTVKVSQKNKVTPEENNPEKNEAFVALEDDNQKPVKSENENQWLRQTTMFKTKSQLHLDCKTSEVSEIINPPKK